MSKSRLSLLLPSLMLACSATALMAQEPVQVAQAQMAQLPSTSVTVSATRREQPVSEVPATVSVITSQQIEENFATDIKDLIQYEPGVSVRSATPRFGAALAGTGRDGNSGFNIRGLEGNRVLIITDGIRMPDAFSFGGQSVGRGDYMDLDTIKSVEILRGPASALYGSDGVAGAISFTTKDPSDYLRNGRNYALQYSPGYKSADQEVSNSIMGAWAEGPLQAMVSYTRRDGHELDNMGTNNAANVDRTTPNPLDISSNAVLAKGIYTLNEAHRFRLTYEYFDTGMDANVLSAIAKPPLAGTSVLGLTAHDSNVRSRYSLDYRYTGAPGDLVQRGIGAVYFQRSKSFQSSFEDRNTAADRIRINTFDNGVFGATGQVESSFMTGDISHFVIVGGDFSLDRQEGIRDGTVPPAGETFPTRAFPNTDYTLAGFFIQDEIRVFGDRLALYPAMRVDHYSLDTSPDALLPGFTPSNQSDSHFSPKFGAVWKFTPALNVYASFSQGFKSPSPSQVNNFFANTVANYRSIPNPNLRPETSETIEGGIRYEDGVVQASASVFSGHYNDFIEQVQVGGNFTPLNPTIFQFINRSSVRISGAEGKLGYRFGDGFDVIAAISYAYGNSFPAGVRTPLDTVDPVKVVAGLGYRDPENRFGGRLTATHSQGKDRLRTSPTLCTPSCYLPDSFTILDATAFWSVSENFTFRAGIFNVFDTRYAWWSDVRGIASNSPVIDAYTQPGRNFGISLTARL
jgi:hemoglobin/transferrin/lactoferrin receptor protein